MIRFVFILILNLFFTIHLSATNIDGTSAFKQQTTNYLLRDTNTVKGFVRFADGFTILEGANHGSAASLDICLSCSGGFDLQGTSTLILLGDLKLDSATTLTSSGKIYSYNRALVLGGDLTLAANQVIHLDGNLIIDGQGHDIFLNEHSQLMLDSNATVTIANATIHNKRNSPGWPSIAITTTTTRLTLSDVELALDSDFYVNSGQLFIHNDVAVTGTSALVWHSIGPCTIEPNSCLYFDTGTTFSYAPPTTNKDLIRMADKSSTLHLNGCSLLATHTGLRLTKGTVLLDNNVQFDSAAVNKLNSVTKITSQEYGNYILTIKWSPNGRYLVIGGNGATGGLELQFYSFIGGTLNFITSQDYGSNLRALSWSPDGRYIAMGGNSTSGGNELHINSFDGNSTATITVKDWGNTISTVSWSPDGRYLAVGGYGPGSLYIYSFDGKTLTTVTSQQYGTVEGATVRTVSWSPNGQYLAVGGNGATGDLELQIYQFKNNTLTPVVSSDFGGGINRINTVSWSPDGCYLALGGGYNNENELHVYSFNGSTLTLKDSKNAPTSCIYTVEWSSNGHYLVIGEYQNNSGTELTIYSFNGTSLTSITTQELGATIYVATWSPDGQYIAIGNTNPSLDTKELWIDQCNYVNETATQATTNGIVLGNNAQGSGDDINLTLFGNTRVDVNGILNFDNSTTQPTFCNRNACFVLQNSSSKIHLTPDSVLGWKDGSIIKAASGVGEGDYNLQGYTGADSIVGYSEAPMSLVYSTSRSVQGIDTGVDVNVDVNDEEVTYAEDTTISNFTIYNEGLVIEDGVTLTINAATIVYGTIDLSGGGVLKITAPTTLAPGAQFTSGGTLEGNEGTIILSSDLSLPSNQVRSPGSKRLKIRGHLRINGRGHKVIFDCDSEFIVDANASFTLANMIIVEEENPLTYLSISDLLKDDDPTDDDPFELKPPYVLRDPETVVFASSIGLLADSSQLTLDSVKIALDRDFTLTHGKLYIYNDVVFTGTNKFSYASTQPMYINSFSNLCFDYGATFSYSPGFTRPNTAAQRTLINMSDKTATITFNSCSIELPDYGMQLTKGTVIFDNKVTFNGNTAALNKAHSFELGDGISADNDVAVKVLSGAWVDVNGYLYHNPA